MHLFDVAKVAGWVDLAALAAAIPKSRHCGICSLVAGTPAKQIVPTAVSRATRFTGQIRIIRSRFSW